MPTSVAILACDNKVDEHAFGGVGRVLPQVIHVDVDLPEEKVRLESRETISFSTQLSFYCYVTYATLRKVSSAREELDELFFGTGKL
jgi:hypothetical protein